MIVQASKLTNFRWGVKRCMAWDEATTSNYMIREKEMMASLRI